MVRLGLRSVFCWYSLLQPHRCSLSLLSLPSSSPLVMVGFNCCALHFVCFCCCSLVVGQQRDCLICFVRGGVAMTSSSFLFRSLYRRCPRSSRAATTDFWGQEKEISWKTTRVYVGIFSERFEPLNASPCNDRHASFPVETPRLRFGILMIGYSAVGRT